MVVQPESVLSVVTNQADAPLLVGSSVTKIKAVGTGLRVTGKTTASNVTWLNVEVTTGPSKGAKGKIRDTYVD
jgi:hypothetical protein